MGEHESRFWLFPGTNLLDVGDAIPTDRKFGSVPVLTLTSLNPQSPPMGIAIDAAEKRRISRIKRLRMFERSEFGDSRLI